MRSRFMRFVHVLSSPSSYLVDQLDAQARAANVSVSKLYFACGSGGTAAGLALGLRLLKLAHPQFESKTTSTADCISSGETLGLGGAELVALGVDDSPNDFYNKIEAIYRDMGKQDIHAID